MMNGQRVKIRIEKERPYDRILVIVELEGDLGSKVKIVVVWVPLGKFFEKEFGGSEETNVECVRIVELRFKKRLKISFSLRR